MLALRVVKERAERLKKELSALRLLDPMREFRVDDDFIEIPVLGARGIDLERWGAALVDQSQPLAKTRRCSPYEEIISKVDIPEDLIRFIPRRWVLLGDILILKLNDVLREYDKEIATVYAEVLKAKTVLEEIGGIVDEYRKPQVRKIIGNGTETVHKENGVLFKLDASEIMFSSGNIHERIRMSKICNEEDIVVDMFAGIGYFSIPMAIHSQPREIYSIEINPVAFGYLCENVVRNKVEDVICPILGNCMQVAPEGLATRVVVGYLRRGERHLSKAMKIVGDEGIIHYHETCPHELLPDRPLSIVRKVAESQGRSAKVIRWRRVKSYAPGVSHIVLDIQVT